MGVLQHSMRVLLAMWNLFRILPTFPILLFFIWSIIGEYDNLSNILTQCVRHNDNRFDYYNEGIAHTKHIITDQIRYIGKESNNIDEASILRIDDDSYLEYDNVEEFKQWILSLKPKDVRDKGISKQTLWNIKKRIRKNAMKYKSKALKGIYKVYQERKLNN